MKDETNPSDDANIRPLRMRVIIRLLCTRRRFVPQGPTKVAQHFSAGSTFYNAKRPATDDRSELHSLRCWRIEKRPFLSSLPGRTYLLHHFPALKCWATFVESLQDGGSSKVRPGGARSPAAAHARQLKATRRRRDGVGRLDLPHYGRAKTSARLVCTPFGYASLRAGFEPFVTRRLELFPIVTQRVSRSSDRPHYRHISETRPIGVGRPYLFVTPIESYTEIAFVSGQRMAQTRRVGKHNQRAYRQARRGFRPTVMGSSSPIALRSVAQSPSRTAALC
jgi:hypothetical protein